MEGSMWGDSPFSEDDAKDYEDYWSEDDEDGNDDSWFYFDVD